MGYADKCVECHFCSGGVATLFKGHRFDKNTDISNINQSDNVFLYVSEGSLEIAAGHLSPEILVEGTMLFIPSSISLYGRTLTDSNIVTCIFSRNMLSCGHHILKDIEKEATAADAVVTYRLVRWLNIFLKCSATKYFDDPAGDDLGVRLQLTLPF